MCGIQVFVICMCCVLLALCMYVHAILCGFVLCVVPCVLPVVWSRLCGLYLCALFVHVCYMSVTFMCCVCCASECVSLFPCFMCDMFCTGYVVPVFVCFCIGHV